MNWNRLTAKIPKSFKTGKSNFKVIFIDKFEDKKQVGMSDWNNKCIYIKKKQSNKELIHTYFHELLHIFSDEFEIKLSEKQVQKLEKTLIYWIKKDNILK